MSLAEKPCTSDVPRRSVRSAIILALRGSAFSSAFTHSHLAGASSGVLMFLVSRRE